MLSESNFIIRASARREGNYYIDYSGEYKISGIALVSGLDIPEVQDIYLKQGGELDTLHEVYYFDSIISARKAVSEILTKTGHSTFGKLVFLTETEIEYIRNSLIKEGTNTVGLNRSLKDEIFKKLNG